MSTKIMLVTITLISMLFVGCDEQIEKPGIPSLDYLDIKGPDGAEIEGSYDVSALGYKVFTFSINSSLSNPEIEIKTVQNSNLTWLAYSRTDNSNYTISADFNNSISDRYGTICINTLDHGYELFINVTQYGRKLDVKKNGDNISSGSQIEISAIGGDSSIFEVKADGEYTISRGSNDSWYTVTHSKENNTFFVTATANTTNGDREGTITIALAGLPTGESKAFTIKVIQSKGSEPIRMLYTPGSGNGWNFNSGWLQTDDFINYYGFSHLDQEFKITDRPSWDGIVWGDGGNGKIEKGAYNNIPFPEEGLFWVKVNLQTETFSVNKVSTIIIVGELINDFWQPIYLTPTDDDKLIWSGDATFAKGNEWVFGINFINSEIFSWGGEYFGEKDGFLIAQEDGDYSITLDLTTIPYKYNLTKK